MPARLLAYGGTSFSERRRIGVWPAVPEATLRDSYGLTPNSWCYGFGVLEAQPFLIFRQRQNVEQRGGYPFSLLLDPGEAVWQRFEWNAAALADGLLADYSNFLFLEPEKCSADTLERYLAGLRYQSVDGAPSDFSYLMVAAAKRGQEPIVVCSGQRAEPSQVAPSLASLPVCFRAGSGWLVGGGAAHGRALGASIVMDDVASATGYEGITDAVESGRKLLSAWQGVPANDRAALPLWAWPENATVYLDAVLLLDELNHAQAADDRLMERVEAAAALRPELDAALERLLARGSGPLGPKASALLVGMVLQSKRKMDANVMARLDPMTVRTELRRYGSPPKPVPANLPAPRVMRVSMWMAYLETLQSEVRQNLSEALKQLGPNFQEHEREELVRSALHALPASDEKLLEWGRFRKDQPTWALIEEPLREVSLRRFQRNGKGAAEAYLVLGGDPGGVAADKALPLKEDAVRLVNEIRDLSRDYPEESQEWIEALKRSPLRDRLPRTPITKSTPLPFAVKEEPVPPNDELLQSLRQLLFDTAADSVDDRTAELLKRYKKPLRAQTKDFDAMVAQGCEQDCDRFVTSFYNKYSALGDVMSYLSSDAQDRLLACFAASKEANLASFAARDVMYALNNAHSQNAYTRALSRWLLQDRPLRKRIAMELGEFPDDFERKLLRLVAKKDGRS